MKPRTKLQRTVMEICEYLPAIRKKEKDYAVEKLFPKLAFANKTNGFCLECGKDIDLKKIVNDTVSCRHCKAKLRVEYNRKRKFSLTNYKFSTSHLIKYGGYDFQLIRTYEFFTHYEKGKKKVIYFQEICRNFYEIGGKETHVSRLESWSGNFNGDLEVRANSKAVYYNSRDYNIAAHIHYPETELRPEYVKIGINHETLSGTSLKSLIRDLSNSEVETVIKAGYLGVYHSWRVDDVIKYFQSLKICIRNNYEISDPTIYLDLLKALSRLKLDLRNAHYVCPADLHAAHDFYMKKLAKLEEVEALNRQRIARLREIRMLTFTDEQYKKEKASFLDLCFTKNNIEIKPLSSIKEFEIEGTELNHCVYRSKYYLEEESLILSAKVKGERVETIEVDLENFKIRQCRGYGNNPSEHHDKILDLIQSKMGVIQRKAKSSRKKLQLA